MYMYLSMSPYTEKARSPCIFLPIPSMDTLPGRLATRTPRTPRQ